MNNSGIQLILNYYIKNVGTETTLKPLNYTIYKLENQQGIIFNMLDEQRNNGSNCFLEMFLCLFFCFFSIIE